MKFQYYCPYCEKTVSTHTLLAGNDLKLALNSEAQIELIHTPEVVEKPPAGDHRWYLNNNGKEKLRNQVASGALSL
jgi:hypothetical protein